MKKTAKTKKKEKPSVDVLKSQLARVLADYDNLQKRVEKEKSIYRQVSAAYLIVKLLPVLDMLEDAQEHLKDSGLAITIKEFYDVLESEGAEKVKVSKGMMFDENKHEAIETVDKGGKNGQIIKVMLSGWELNKELMRPAKVRVVKRKK
jgi:molecular chaperone GrpE